MPCLPIKHQQIENQLCTRKVSLENKHSSPAKGTGEISPTRHTAASRGHTPFQAGRNFIPSVVPSRGELQTTNPSSNLASLFGKVITHHQNHKVEQIKGSASLTHSYARPQPSQDSPALHQHNDHGKMKEKGEGSTFLQGTKLSVQAGKAGSSLAATITS